MNANTIDLHDVRATRVNDTARKPISKPSRSPRPRKAAKPDNLKGWATAGVGLMLTLSAALNGFANSLHSPSAWAGWAMGVTVPAIILILGKCAGMLYHRGHIRLAYALGAVGSGLLLLSVWHCSLSIALLTGSPVALAVPMGLAIDAGLIGCELAALTA